MFKLRLNNYRGFINAEFDFSRVNILIGENSAGKSSVLKFLMALKQSLHPANTRELNFTFKGVETDLGNYREVIYKHETERSLCFAFEFDNLRNNFAFNFLAPSSDVKDKEIRKSREKTIKEVREYLGQQIVEPSLAKFELSHDLSEHSTINAVFSNSQIGSVELHPTPPSPADYETSEIIVRGEARRCSIHFHSVEFDRTFVVEDIAFEKQAFLSIIDGESLLDGLAIFDELKDKLYTQIGYLLVTQNRIIAALAKMVYMNPLLSDPADRVYVEGDRKNSPQTGDIKELVEFLSTNPFANDLKLDLEKVLASFGIADSLYIRKEGFTRELRVLLNSVDSNIKDVGFGVSLQMPIFAQALISERTRRRNFQGIDEILGESLIIEQPEVHLHPRLQAKFIDLLLEIGNNNVYFIETHSEHIIRMLQLIVKENRYGLSSENLTIHYLRNQESQFSISRHTIANETGKLVPQFPKGFYDVSYNLAFELMD